ncbi:MAG: SDR family NAD(P)-dependent oxidoreductase [Sphingobium sp.]
MAIAPMEGVTLVAGGAGGIGREICRTLAAAGRPVAFTYRSKADVAQHLRAELEGMGVQASCAAVDHADEHAVKAFVDDAAARFGGVASLVYAAGPHLPLKFVSAITPQEWRSVFEADVNGAFNLVWATLPHLRDKGGSMVAVITAAVERVPSRDICSAAPKAAIEMLFRGVALEEGRFGIRANCVGPGFIDAGLGAELIGKPGLENFVEGLRKALPLKRFGAAEDIANAVLFLLSDQARYITGQSLAVDGGLQL